MRLGSMIAAPGYLYAVAWSMAAVLFCLFNPPSRPAPQRILIWLCLTVGNVLFTIVTDTDIDLFYFPTLFACLFFVYGILRLTCRITKTTAVYYLMCSFLVGELVNALSWLLVQYTAGLRGGEVTAIQVYGFFALALALTLPELWLFERRYASEEGLRIDGKELAANVLVALGVFLFSNISNVFSDTPFSGQTPLHISQLRMLADFGGLMMLAANRIAREELRRKNEAEMLAKVMALQQANYQVSEQSIQLIHQKYHDLKHQIELLRREAKSAKGQERLDRMEAEIQGFEALIHTGNPTMDTLVTAKALQCQSLGIRLTCMAEGSLLGFLSEMDLCALLGNLLDNAIEHVTAIEDQERRWIQLNLRKHNGFILLETGNPCDDALQFSGGLPVTTKRDRDYHGYGTRSIRRIAESYGGTATFSCQNGWFEVRVLFNAQRA